MGKVVILAIFNILRNVCDYFIICGFWWVFGYSIDGVRSYQGNRILRYSFIGCMNTLYCGSGHRTRLKPYNM